MSKLVTIIIPIYNSEKYLEECLKSVLNQTYTNMEILCVDNGSTDKSNEILVQYRNIDKRIEIIKVNEKGVSIARNKGIEKAKGDYVLFVDSDDVIDVRMVEKLVDIAQKKDSDMVICTNSLLNPKGKERKINFDIKVDERKNIVEEKKEKTFEYIYSKGVGIQVWNKLIKKNILIDNDVRFNERMSYDEDMFFCWKCTMFSNVINIIQEDLYKYRLTNGSAITKYYGNLENEYKNAFIDISNELIKKNIDNKYIKEIIQKIYEDKIKVLIIMESRSSKKIGEKVKTINRIINNKESEKYIKKSDRLYYIGIYRKNAVILLIWAIINNLKQYIARIIK